MLTKSLMGKEEVKDNEEVRDGVFTEENKSNREAGRMGMEYEEILSKVIQL